MATLILGFLNFGYTEQTVKKKKKTAGFQNYNSALTQTHFSWLFYIAKDHYCSFKANVINPIYQLLPKEKKI